ncbi:molybdenum cofactor cytidylyltransferase/nicotine blue oxidoreductase [Micromonospora pattaloongensis]|uniref:Molybdenum cofactor cytidylyltransferase/nicotine blue oxidoreductase n=1 Tax=Micromonospora pattaloongensis TaxID=405436 RepID=A0A1H3QFZ1_9ACTN|nr:nucleotidyltransferase family protein [Micromonospora pattaloongensis]SDZ12277.1 molybdenum cofactor cytidylyltransferase/nicotine blue oxidoreductase [Micromonospora pattaloongensis]
MIIAAGGGRNIGGPEALLYQGERLLVERMLETVREAGLSPIVVVLGAGAEEVRAVADLRGASVVVNRAWGTGLGSSLRVGLGALTMSPVEAVAVMPVDMPGITPEALRRVSALPYPDVLVCATYGGLRNYPMVFGRKHWPAISDLGNTDGGARPYLLAHREQVVDVSCDGVGDGSRVDTPELVAEWGLTVPAQRVPAS